MSDADLDTLLRKGLFLRRTFLKPRGPMTDDAGNPTSIALAAQRWGEAVPKNSEDARKLAEKGRALLDEYHATKALRQLRTAA